MNHIAPRVEPLIREIPLNRLVLAPENVRKTPADRVAEAEIKASIAAHGLLENLVARMDGPADAGTYAVVAGGRRLAAQKALAEDGTFDADHPVPCLIAADTAVAGELSLAENVVRIAMHPADQVVAFTTLADAGLSVAAIAARFGLAERLVEQRLRLGNVAPQLLDEQQKPDDVGLFPVAPAGLFVEHPIEPADLLPRQEAGERRAPVLLHSSRRVRVDVTAGDREVHDLPELVESTIGIARRGSADGIAPAPDLLRGDAVHGPGSEGRQDPSCEHGPDTLFRRRLVSVEMSPLPLALDEFPEQRDGARRRGGLRRLGTCSSRMALAATPPCSRRLGPF